jgi:GH24 family phage-related lysozyme (muramidase)
MTPDLLAQIKANCEREEGRVPHFYLDTRGAVTVAIGHLVPSLAHAVSLRMEPKEIIPADFEAVNAAEPGLLAKAYERLCHARMTDEDIDARLSFDIAICEAQLDHRLDITTFPDPAAAACLDMAVNLGVSGLMTFTKLCAAAKEADWVTCASECYRHGISDQRNRWTAGLFRAAAAASST